MAYIKNLDTNEMITEYVSLRINQKVNRVVHTTLDGRQLIQRFGEPAVSYLLNIYVTVKGKELLFLAENKASLLEVMSNGSIYYGRITEMSIFDKVSNKYYKTSLTLAREENTA